MKHSPNTPHTIERIDGEMVIVPATCRITNGRTLPTYRDAWNALAKTSRTMKRLRKRAVA